MAKLKTLAEKQEIRYRMVYMAFASLLLTPVAAYAMITFGFDPAPATGIIATTAASMGGVIIGFFATAPKDDVNEGFKDIKAI